MEEEAMPKNNPTIWVITYEPERLGSLYYGEDGKPSSWNKAAEFLSWEDAKRFADAHRIQIGGTVSIIIKRKIVDTPGGPPASPSIIPR